MIPATLAVAGVVGLIVSGSRILWYDPYPIPELLAGLLDAISPEHGARKWHLVFACIGMFGGLSLALSDFFSGRMAQILKGKQGFAYGAAYAVTLVAGVLAVLSGYILYRGLPVGSSLYASTRRIHYLLLFYFAALVIAWVAVFAFSMFTKKKRESAYVLRGTGLIFALSLGGMFVVLFALSATRGRVLISKPGTSIVTVDGYAASHEWDSALPLRGVASSGGNFNDGVTQFEIRSVHMRQSIYFLIRWEDPDRSFNRVIEKTPGGWRVRETESPSRFGEMAYYEDQLALSLHDNPAGCVQTCHFPQESLKGIHATDGDTVDVWVWKSVSTDPVSTADDGWWGELVSPDSGGRHVDNAAYGGYYINLHPDWYQPYFFPPARGARYWINLQSDHVTPYFAEEDTFSVGTHIPAMLVSRFRGDRGDLLAQGVWSRGVWTVELMRRLKTGSPYDTPIEDTLYLGLAFFDNAEFKHAFHFKPITLIIER